MNRETWYQVRWFVVAGVCATGADALVYFSLVHGVALGHDKSKFLSFLTGTLVAYMINKFRTFQSPRRSWAEAARFFALYAATLGVNVGANHGVLALWSATGRAQGPPARWWVLAAFVVATGLSTILNFVGQKYFVFHRGAA